MKKTLALSILFFAMLISLNAAEAPTQIKDSNCTSEKCKTKKSKDANCTLEKCKTKTKKDCAAHMKKHCSRDGNKTSPKWNAKMDGNSTIKSSHCSKGKKAEEEKPMKCAAGKCGGDK